MEISEKSKQRFFNKIVITDSCHFWKGARRNDGYGIARVNGQNIYVHRLAFLIHFGRLPSSMLDHTCRNRDCVNPQHLQEVTAAENLYRSPDTKAAQNLAKTHCPQGHPYSPTNTYTDKKGRRSCKECNIEASKRFRARNN